MKKRNIFTFLSLSSALMLGSLSLLVSQNVNKADAVFEEVDSDISSVQVRSAGGEENYLVIQDKQIEVSYPHEAIGWTDEYNAPEKIKVYTNKDTYVFLSDIIDTTRFWTINRWQSFGVMFPINGTNFNTYNGTTIYQIEILNGCTYPNNKSQKVVNKQDHKFINLHYGEVAAKNEAFDWAEDKMFERSDQTLEIFAAQIRGNAGGFYIALRSKAYEEEPNINLVNLEGVINVYDQVLISLNEEDPGTPLGEIVSSRNAIINKWGGTFAFMFPLSTSEHNAYNGKTIHHIKVPKDTELICQDKIWTVATTATLINPEDTYGKDSSKNAELIELTPPVKPAPLEEPIALESAQVRADVGDSLYFIDFIADAFNDKGHLDYEDFSNVNLYSFIKIYMSKAERDDNQGKTIGEITSLRQCSQNEWDAKGFFIALTDEEYDDYNGQTIYMIEVLKGCEIYVDGAVATIDKNYIFLNASYGNPEAKYENFNFSMDASDLTNFGTINIINIHNRMDSTHRGEPDCRRWIMFLVDDSIYGITRGVGAWADKLNFLDNISIYKDKDSEPYTLRSIYNPTGGISTRQFGENNMLGVTISNAKDGDEYRFDGPHMYSMVIEAGTQIPSVEDGDNGYRVIKDKTLLINDEYGMSGPIANTKDDEGDPRLYEEWNLSWTVIRCFVNFTVVGIDGLSFPEISLEKGQRVSLSDYEQEGYSLEATTSDGDKIYKDIIGLNHNLSVTLTYTPKQVETVILWNVIIPIAIGGGVLLIGGAVVAIFLLRKKKGARA